MHREFCSFRPFNVCENRKRTNSGDKREIDLDVAEIFEF